MIKWNKENKNKLKELWQSHSDEDIAKIFGTSVGSIITERRRLRLIRKTKTIRNKTAYSYEQVRKMFKDKGYFLLDKSYKNFTTKMNYVCFRHFNHGVQKIALCELLRGRGCYCCGRDRTASARQHSDDYYVEECNKRNFTYVGRYVNPKSQTTQIKYICNKHPNVGVQVKAINNLKQSNCCPHCRISKGEARIENYLTERHIPFKKEKRFSDCKYKYTLPFDFYLYGSNTVIEYDGEQHFFPVSFSGLDKDKAEENFELEQLKDKIKTDYCAKNNIKLIRIPYWDYDNIYSILDNAI